MAASCLALVVSAAWPANAQDANSPYPAMAPLDQYLIAESQREIALARTAAPESISRDARSWSLDATVTKPPRKAKTVSCALCGEPWAGAVDDPGFWNPKSRSPVCFNPPARDSTSDYPQKNRTGYRWRTKTQMFADITTAFDKKEFPALEPAAMCYMLFQTRQSKRPCRPLASPLMFFVPLADPQAGAQARQAPSRRSIYRCSRATHRLSSPVPSGPMATPAPVDDH